MIFLLSLPVRKTLGTPRAADCFKYESNNPCQNGLVAEHYHRVTRTTNLRQLRRHAGPIPFVLWESEGLLSDSRPSAF